MNVMEIATRNTRRLKVGDLVETVRGNVGTIIEIDECQVYIAADPEHPKTTEMYKWYHPAKVWPVARETR